MFVITLSICLTITMISSYICIKRLQNNMDNDQVYLKNNDWVFES